MSPKPTIASARQRVAAADTALFDRVSRVDSPVLDATMPPLSQAADYSRLWMGIAAGLLAGGRRNRRAAVRGLATVAVTSAVANQLAKRLSNRDRPEIAGVPRIRWARRIPASSSFPSGHSASAAAFAVGAALESPRTALPLGALAGAVGFSRVYTGVHYPGDVAAGFALGAGLAVAGKALLPARPAPAHAPRRPEPAPQPPRPDGRGLVAVINPASGPSNRPPLAQILAERLPAAEVVELGEHDDVAETMRAAAERAQALAVGGGDGTVNCAADAAMAAGIPLLVLPGGTFNHFAGDLGLDDADPDELTDAMIEALKDGRAVRVDVGVVDDRIFLNTASIGNYPAFVRHRERWESRVGKPIAAAIATWQVLRREPALDVVIDGRPRRVALVFVGSGRYQPSGYLPRGRNQLDDGLLDIRLIDAGRPVEFLRLVGAALIGRLRHSPIYSEWTATEVVVDSPGGSTDLARDGEVTRGGAVFRFGKRRRALTVYWARPDGE